MVLVTDFSEEELRKYGDTVTLSYRSTKQTITLKSEVEQYLVEADDFTEITAVLDHFLIKLIDHNMRMGAKDFRFNIKHDKEFVRQLIHKFLKCVETHAKERNKLKELEVTFEIRMYNILFKKCLYTKLFINIRK